MARKHRILILMHEDLVPPEKTEGLTDEQTAAFKTEFDVGSTLREMGHEVIPVGLRNELGVLREAIEIHKPDITFNLLEEFHGIAHFDQHVVSYLELMRQRYTGCNPRGLTLARDKALTKKILAYHRIRVPQFAVFPIGRKVRRPRKLPLPLFVKSLTEEGSLGISRASIVRDDEQLAERVAFIHRQTDSDAIAEQYIEGRELYVGVLGNRRIRTLPIWELLFTKLPPDVPRIATGKVKWDYKYQEKAGVISKAANDLPDGADRAIPRLARRIYRTLGLSGYARLDFRLTPDGDVYLLEANPNPQLAYGEDFAESAESAGIDYEKLLASIMKLGFQYRASALLA